MESLDLIKLIDLVKQRQVLYDELLPDYKNPDKRYEAWVDVSKQMGYSVDHCRHKWQSLRSQFNKNLKKNHTNWIYFEPMLFLRDHLRSQRKSMSFNAESKVESLIFNEKTDSLEISFTHQPRHMDFNDDENGKSKAQKQLSLFRNLSLIPFKINFNEIITAIHKLPISLFICLIFALIVILSIDGKSLKISKDTLEFFYDTVQSSHIDDYHKQITSTLLLLSNNIEPIVIGNFYSRFGIYFILPFYFEYQNPEDIDEDLVVKYLGINYEKLNNDLNEDGTNLMKKLKECLIFSKDAKKFAIWSLIHNHSLQITFYAESMGLMIIPYIFYQFGINLRNFLSIKTPMVQIGTMLLGYLMYGKMIIQVKKIQNRFGNWSVFKYETDDENRSEPSDDYLKGAEEYLNKLDQLQAIINKYSSNSNILFNYFSMSTYYPIYQQLKDVKRFNRLCISNGLKMTNVIYDE